MSASDAGSGTADTPDTTPPAAISHHDPAAPHDEAAQRLVLELAVTAGGVGTFDWDLVSGRLVWDERLLDMFGLDRTRPVLHIDEFFGAVHPGDRDRVETLLRHAVDTVGVYDAEYRVVLPGGGIRWIAARGRALAGPDGRAVRLLGAAQDTTARRDSEARIARVMDSMSTAFFFLDRDWRFAYVNAEAQRVLGRRADDLLGKVVWDEFPAAVSSDFGTYYRYAMDSDEPVAFDAHYPEPLNGWYEVRAWPSPDGLAVYFLDVTDRHEAHVAAQRAISRAALLARVSEQLGATLEADEAMATLARVLVPDFGDWCVVILPGDDRRAPTTARLGHAVGWHADPSQRHLVDRYAQVHLQATPVAPLAARAVQSTEMQLITANAAAVLGAMLPPGAAAEPLLRALAPTAAVLVPLHGNKQPVGALLLCSGAGRSAFSDEDLELVRDIAVRAGVVLDRARLYRQQRQVAESLQRSLLTAPPRVDHLRIAVRYVPAAEVAQVGGDWYDAFVQPDGSVVLVIGDVVGHDLHAAATMGEMRTLVRTLAARSGGHPAQVLSEAEEVLARLKSDTIATVVAARLETVDAAGGVAHRLRFSNAGHPPPLLVAADGEVTVLGAAPANPLLGVGTVPRHEHRVDLPPASTVLFYTDGLVERRGQPIDTGMADLCRLLRRLAGSSPDALCDAVLDLLPDRPEDDVALLAVQIAEAGSPAR